MSKRESNLLNVFKPVDLSDPKQAKVISVDQQGGNNSNTGGQSSVVSLDVLWAFL